MTDKKVSLNKIALDKFSDFLSGKKLQRLISKGWKVVNIDKWQCNCGSCDISDVVILKKKDKIIKLWF